MKGKTQSRLPLYAFVGFTFVMSVLPAEAHLNTTGMGPFYDGLMHFLHEPRRHRSGTCPGATGWTARRQSWAARTLHSSRCVVARRSRRTKRCDSEAASIYRRSLVSLAWRIAGRRRQSFIARDYRPCRSAGCLSRIRERNRHGAIRHCSGSDSRTGVRRVRPDFPRRGVRSSATRAMGSNRGPRGWKLDRSQRSPDARLGGSNPLGKILARAPAEPLRNQAWRQPDGAPLVMA